MAIADYLFPLQSLTTKAAMTPEANMMGLASSPFMTGAGPSQAGFPLMGLAGLADQYGAMREGAQQAANAFASQTPGAPSAPGRVDETSFGQGADPFSLLMANISKRFGG